MKVGFLNPWSNAAENQAYMSQAIAARRIGLELLGCRDEIELEASQVDFVISIASSVPKVCDYPTYLNVHEPTSRFLRNEVYLRNLMSYDGYLTIADSLRRFVRDVSFGVGRSDEPGFYFDTPQKSDTCACIPEIVKQRNLQVVYFGTNWDRRSPELFDLLDAKGILRIHGPIHSWPNRLESYAGPLPFDGIAPQLTYASFGAGLVLLSVDHLREDVVSNRVFEISSVGAVSICPDIPWIRRWFGDAVFYFDPQCDAQRIAAQVMSIHEYCKTHPQTAAKMGQDARAIFEKNFSAEVMLSNAADYHLKKQNTRSGRRKALGQPPLIAVIMRCGGRDVGYLKRAIASVGNQSFGRFALVLVKYRTISLSEILSDAPSNIERIVELECPNANRSATLFAGLAKLRELDAEYFAVLDDDDFWLSNHMESLFSAAKRNGREFDVIFSGSVAVAPEAREIEKHLFWRRNIYRFGYPRETRSIGDVVGVFSSNCFVARTSLVVEEIDFPEMETAEDSLIVSLVARCRKPIFSYQATAFHTQSAPDGSRFESHPLRRRDEISWLLRSGLLYSPAWLSESSISGLLQMWSHIVDRLATATERLDSVDLVGLISELHWVGASVNPGEPVVVVTVEAAWGYSARLPLARVRESHRGDDDRLFWEVEAQVHTGDVGFGLIDRDELIEEKFLKPADGHAIVHLRAAAVGAELMVRNGAHNRKSLVAIHGVRLVRVTSDKPSLAQLGGGHT